MSKSPSNPIIKDRVAQDSAQNGASGILASCQTEHKASPSVPQKSKLEKTQSVLSVTSTSIGLIGVAGSVFAFATATFYTGSVEVKPDLDVPGVVVKVYTKEGHESVFHAKHIDLMPGDYHLEISAPDSKVVHSETKVRFHKTSTIPVKLIKVSTATEASTAKESSTATLPENAREDQNAEDANKSIETSSFFSPQEKGQETESSAKSKKHHWWQFWRHAVSDSEGTGGKQ